MANAARGHPAVDLVFRHTVLPEAEGDVLFHRHMREQRVLLEYRIDGALVRWKCADFFAKQTDSSLSDILKAGNHEAPGDDEAGRERNRDVRAHNRGRPGRGAAGWGNRANYITLNAVQTSPTEMSLFMYGGGHYKLRLDGFISVHAAHAKGTFLTKPLKFAGHQLELNYSTAGAGEIRVELQDAQGRPIPGRALADCDPMQGDAIAGHVTWKGSADLSQFAGQTVRLRFEMNEADIFSLKFPSPPSTGSTRQEPSDQP